MMKQYKPHQYFWFAVIASIILSIEYYIYDAGIKVSDDCSPEDIYHIKCILKGYIVIRFIAAVILIVCNIVMYGPNLLKRFNNYIDSRYTK